jgi:hypothetical protein
MATTTPNYGWTVPTSTDLVKDGATAIETLGDAIDASMNTALGTNKAMGVLLSTVSFSAVASQSINNVFSTTYDNYFLTGNLSTTGGDITLRLRVAGADDSAANYAYGLFRKDMNSTTFGNDTESTTATGFAVAITNPSSTTAGYKLYINNPFVTARTTFEGTTISNTLNAYYTSGIKQATTSFTGFTLICSGAFTMTGNVSVYGYNK